jgi:hypothetical protein
VRLTTPHSKKLIVTKVEQRKSWMDLMMMERVGGRWEKNGRILFDRPKPTVGCSASGRRRRKKNCVTLKYVARRDNLTKVHDSSLQTTLSFIRAYIS